MLARRRRPMYSLCTVACPRMRPIPTASITNSTFEPLEDEAVIDLEQNKKTTDKTFQSKYSFH